MRTLHRNKRKLYLCESYELDNRRFFKEPVKLFENWQYISTDASFEKLGWEAYDYIRIKTNLNHANYYHMGDRLYIGIEPPEEHDKLCTTANFEVYKDPIVTLNEVEVVCKKLSGRNGEKNIF